MFVVHISLRHHLSHFIFCFVQKLRLQDNSSYLHYYFRNRGQLILESSSYPTLILRLTSVRNNYCQNVKYEATFPLCVFWSTGPEFHVSLSPDHGVTLYLLPYLKLLLFCLPWLLIWMSILHSCLSHGLKDYFRIF